MCLKDQFSIHLRARISHFLKKGQNRGFLLAYVLDIFIIFAVEIKL